jgi:hypothetical protein
MGRRIAGKVGEGRGTPVLKKSNASPIFCFKTGGYVVGF